MVAYFSQRVYACQRVPSSFDDGRNIIGQGVRSILLPLFPSQRAEQDLQDQVQTICNKLIERFVARGAQVLTNVTASE